MAKNILSRYLTNVFPQLKGLHRTFRYVPIDNNCLFYLSFRSIPFCHIRRSCLLFPNEFQDWRLTQASKESSPWPERKEGLQAKSSTFKEAAEHSMPKEKIDFNPLQIRRSHPKFSRKLWTAPRYSTKTFASQTLMAKP